MKTNLRSRTSNYIHTLNFGKLAKEVVGLLTVIISLTYSSVSFASACPESNNVQDPTDFVWTFHPVSANNPEAYYSGVMEVGETTLIINGETLTTRAYRQLGGAYSFPGPTIKVTPGNKYVLSLHNTLPFEPLNPNHNIFKDPNATNIHTHGLHISGEGNSDDVTRVFEGGFGGDFVWDIPADHMGGTYWYHAHHHGSTFLQVSGGLFGMLIVDDSADGIPAPVAAMSEREMIFGFIDPGAAGTGGDVLMEGTLSPSWTINGLIGGNVCMPANTWEHWRVLVADRAANMKTIEFGPECEVMLLGRDGVWRTVAPKDIPSNTLQLSGASRADFAIRTTGDSWVKVEGNTVVNIYADGTPDPSVHPFDVDGVSTWSAIRPTYLRDLREETVVHTESISMGARTINGGKFNYAEPTLSLPANQVQEWSLSGAVQHPFHLHVYHVQALSDDNGFEAGEYYDVISSKMSVRFDLNSASSTVYDGRTILHCHILGHEDRGAMGWLDVIGGASPPTYPVNGDLAEPYSLYYSLVSTPPSVPADPTDLSANAVSSSSIELSWNDNSNNEEGFDIERSADGTSFSSIGTVLADVQSYSDNDLSASSTYYYRIIAYNGVGNSDPSNTASATTFPSGGGLVLHVEDITVVREELNGNRFRGVATITVHDVEGLVVAGANVSGDFTGPTSSNESGTTNSSGQITFNTGGKKNPNGEWCFEVTNVTLSGATYDENANVETHVCETSVIRSMNSTSSSETSFLSVYPNPVKNSTIISFTLVEQNNVTLELHTLQGKRVYDITNQYFEAGEHTLNLDMEDMAAGTYILKFKAGSTVDAQKLVLIR